MRRGINFMPCELAGPAKFYGMTVERRLAAIGERPATPVELADIPKYFGAGSSARDASILGKQQPERYKCLRTHRRQPEWGSRRRARQTSLVYVQRCASRLSRFWSPLAQSTALVFSIRRVLADVHEGKTRTDGDWPHGSSANPNCTLSRSNSSRQH